MIPEGSSNRDGISEALWRLSAVLLQIAESKSLKEQDTEESQKTNDPESEEVISEDA